MAIKIVSLIEYNGEWVPQEELPEEYVRKMVVEAIVRAGKSIGFEVRKKSEKITREMDKEKSS